MKAVTEFRHIFIHRDPVDMRKAVNGLSEIVEQAQMGELRGPHLFVFTGKKRDVIKILYFDKSGFALWYKRLEQDKFPWPKKFTQQDVIQLTPSQMQWLLDGYDVWKMKPFEEFHFTRVS